MPVARWQGSPIVFLEFWSWLKDKLSYRQQVVGTFVDLRWFPMTLFVPLIDVPALVSKSNADKEINQYPVLITPKAPIES